MTEQEAQKLLDKYIERTCTDEENALVEQWYLLESSKQKLPNTPKDFIKLKSGIWQGIRQMTGLEGDQTRSWIKWRTLTAAAILIIIGSGAYLFIQQESTPKIVKVNPIKVQHDIDPGGDKAILTLADGSKIVLDDAGNGLIATQADIRVRKLADGSIAYDEPASDHSSKSILYNTIETPKGGKYQITLQDGSVVWLNAGSVLKFPAVFTGKERLVQLTGEAYFDVAKNAKIPFKVQTTTTNISVTGTQFNVMAYSDEKYSATTLVEGSVELNNSFKTIALKPGQQGITRPGSDPVKKQVDVDDAIAWKNGLFQFNDSDIQMVMRQIARWYDVSVEYHGGVPTNRFGGYISRDSKLSQVLKMLEISGVKFSIDGQKIIVYPNQP